MQLIDFIALTHKPKPIPIMHSEIYVNIMYSEKYNTIHPMKATRVPIVSDLSVYVIYINKITYELQLVLRGILQWMLRLLKIM